MILKGPQYAACRIGWEEFGNWLRVREFLGGSGLKLELRVLVENSLGDQSCGLNRDKIGKVNKNYFYCRLESDCNKLLGKKIHKEHAFIYLFFSK